MVAPDARSPATTADTSDPGDQTQRNFRYQHAYGAILLTAAATGQRQYKAIWCEHHDDFLAEITDNHFDAYQIKTRKPEIGKWQINHSQLKSSIKHFVMLKNTFGDNIKNFYFVTNSEFLDCSLTIRDQKKLSKSPIQFLKAICEAETEKDIQPPFDETFNDLVDYCECEPQSLFSVLRRLGLINGPGRDSFDAEIAHDHLPCLSECRHLSPPMLNNIRDEIIYKIYDASSLKIDDPAKHYKSLLGAEQSDPKLLAKRVTIESLFEIVEGNSPLPFRFYPGSAELELGQTKRKISVLEKKFIQGGIISQFETMKRRALSTESHLIGLTHRLPEKIESILNQIVSVVQGECDEASLANSVDDVPDGKEMLKDVYKRLRYISKKESAKVEHQSYECLVGVAGLLTGECEIWWSEQFDVSQEI